MFKLKGPDEVLWFETEESVYSFLGQTATADYVDEVEKWIISQTRTPLEIMNGSTKEVWSRA